MQDEILTFIREFLARNLDPPPARVTPRTSFSRDVVLDSLTAFDLLAGLAERFRITLDPWETADIETVGELCGLVAEKVAARAARRKD
jgi:acyl carrier protein